MGNKKALPGRISGVPAGFLPPGLHLMSAVALSSTNTVTSATFNASDFDNLGLQVKFVGTMTGTITVNASINATDFYPLTFDPALTQPAGSAVGYLIDLNQLSFPYFQVSYTNVSGSGTLDVWVSGKDLN